MSSNKSGFGSKLGFVLATAGSAVGLGNIWRFPYLAAKYGGGIFLLVYLILAVTFGFALMLTEIAIGRKTGKTAISAYSAINKRFSFLGGIASAVPCIIFPYYCVIGGWVLKYFTLYISGGIGGAVNDEYFGTFISNASEPMVFFIIFLALTALVVILGVEKGIELVSKIMMPILIFISIAISIYSLTLPGAMDGLKFYLMPNFSNFSLGTIVAAMGQLFYSMSIAMGILITYGSYMRREDNLEGCVKQIEAFDIAVSLLAGLMIVPAVFVFSGGDASAINAGPGLIFTTLPKVFHSMRGEGIIGAVFFILVIFAALTSAISLMEAIVSIIMERFRLKRLPASIITVVISFLIGSLSVLGYSSWSEITILGRQFLDFFDFLSNNIIMPIVALLTCILIGHIAGTKYIEDEVEVTSKFKQKAVYRVMIKYIAPVFMVIIFLSAFVNIGG